MEIECVMNSTHWFFDFLLFCPFFLSFAMISIAYYLYSDLVQSVHINIYASIHIHIYLYISIQFEQKTSHVI